MYPFHVQEQHTHRSQTNVNCSLSILVHYRIFAVTPNIEPIVRDDKTQTDTAITIEFQVLQIVAHSL